MNMELRQWAIEKAIAAGTDCHAVTAIAADFLEFVMGAEATTPVACAKRVKIPEYEAALDAGESPIFAGKRLGVSAANVSSAYTRIRRARGIPPIRTNGTLNLRSTNGAVHS